MRNTQTRNRLNELLAQWPKGLVATHPWFKTHGISRFLVNTYQRSRWVRRIGWGAYARLDDKVEWPGAMHAIQSQLGMPVHVGGKTALEWQGYGHFVPLGKNWRLRLYGPRGTRLPAWFLKHDWEVQPVFRSPHLFATESQSWLTEKSMGDYSFRLSVPERAVLELLDEVPFLQSFEEARQLMEGLTTLRFELVQELLVACRSVKVKRLFMFLAEEAGHTWVKDLEISKVDLGRGKRSVVKGGQLDAKYHITVPPRRDILPKDAP